MKVFKKGTSSVFCALLALVLLVSIFSGCQTTPPADTSDTAGSTAGTTEATSGTTEATTGTTEATQPTETEPVLNYANPLTGEAIAEPMMSRPFAVMMNNVKPAMPMWGVSAADVLVETFAEGGATRCMGIFTDIGAVKRVGSIRSARPYFVHTAIGFDAIYTHIGGSNTAYDLLTAQKWDEIDGNRGPVTKFFTRDMDRYNNGVGIEHTWYITGENALAAAEKKGCTLQREEPLDYGWNFAENATPAGQSASVIQIRFSGKNGKLTKLTYDAQSGVYTAFQHGGDWVDGDSGKVASFTNILYLSTFSGMEDNGVVHTLQLTGSGKGYFACGGKIVAIKWSRDNIKSPFAFTLEDGTPLTMGIGKTYIALAPNNSVISYE